MGLKIQLGMMCFCHYKYSEKINLTTKYLLSLNLVEKPRQHYGTAYVSLRGFVLFGLKIYQIRMSY
jgi:hypothetical protein